jgi:NagD protein
VIVVGDDPALEMRMARAAGAIGIAVPTGMLTRDGLARLTDAEMPDALIDDLSPLCAALAGLYPDSVDR